MAECRRAGPTIFIFRLSCSPVMKWYMRRITAIYSISKTRPYCQRLNCLQDGAGFPTHILGAAISDSACTALVTHPLPTAEMRYVVRGLEIRSENAAKPACSAGRWILNWIRQLPTSASGLDIGCGKLRYTVPPAKRISSVAAVDSGIQLERQQAIFGRVCSVRQYVSKTLRNVTVYSVEDPVWRRKRYDIVLCSNVLSAIPCLRTRKRIVKAAYTCLRPKGTLLLTTQYRSSHFAAWRSAHNATRYLDGFLVQGKRGTSFYGLLDAEALTRLCRSCGFRSFDAGHAKELAYVLARR
jgi:2-polyprenyl-3-methyl-5-hydroxy-6-metoxy-1,4-benzoquinol methylase